MYPGLNTSFKGKNRMSFFIAINKDCVVPFVFTTQSSMYEWSFIENTSIKEFQIIEIITDESFLEGLTVYDFDSVEVE